MVDTHSAPDFTVVSLPKAFAGHTAIIQNNAIDSWTRLGQPVVLVGDDPGTAEAARDHGVRHVPDLLRNPSGAPRVDDVFAKAELSSETEAICYVNADIILSEDLCAAVRALSRQPEWFLATGQRIDIDVEERLAAVNGDVIADLRRRGTPHGPTGLDYFIFRRGLWPRIPAFSLGRTVWDNWLLYAARHRGAMLVDASPVVTALHQNHDYGHVPQGVTGVWKGEDAVMNLRLAGGYGHTATLADATHALHPDGTLARRHDVGRPVRSLRRAVSRLKFAVSEGSR